MKLRQLRFFLLAICGALLCLPACQSNQPTIIWRSPTPELTGAATATQTEEPFLIPVSDPEPTRTETPQPGQVDLPLVESAPAPTLQETETWTKIENNEAYAPILVYHHVSDNGPAGRYTVTVETFREQMETLRKQGFTTITVSTLANALQKNGALPAKPIVITFDDGNLDIYQNAYPIMKSMGFTGVFYIVANRLASDGFVTASQIKEMADAGWEIGSHSLTHADLQSPDADPSAEIFQSRLSLQDKLSLPIQSFAYPYATANESVYRSAKEAGYTSAVCSGWLNLQKKTMLYCLHRREVKDTTTMDVFEKLITTP